MARIRTIKPEFWSSEQVVECSIQARLLFIGLWNFCDDGGVHPASLKRLKMEVFPADVFTPQQMAGWVAELAEQGLILEYEAQGRKWWWVTGFLTHQRIEKPTHRYPRPPTELSEKGQGEAVEPSPPEGNRNRSRAEPSRTGAEPERNCKGAEPEPNRPAPASSKKNSGSGSGWGHEVTSDGLRDNATLAGYYLGAIRAGHVRSQSVASQLAFWTAAVHALGHGDKPASMFVANVKAGRWHGTQAEEEVARRMIKAMEGRG